MPKLENNGDYAELVDASQHTDDAAKAALAVEAYNEEHPTVPLKPLNKDQTNFDFDVVGVPPVDPVNPSHYKTGKRELIDILQDLLTPEEFLGLLKGSFYQYIYRYKSKGGEVDLEKAQWYLERLIQTEYHNKTDPGG